MSSSGSGQEKKQQPKQKQQQQPPQWPPRAPEVEQPKEASTTPPTSDDDWQEEGLSGATGSSLSNTPSSTTGSSHDSMIEEVDEPGILPPSPHLLQPTQANTGIVVTQMKLIFAIEALSRLDLDETPGLYKKQLRKTVDALYTAAQASAGPRQDLSRMHTPVLQQLLRNTLLSVDPLLYPKIDDRLRMRIMHEAFHLYPPFDPTAQLPEVAPQVEAQPGGNWLPIQWASSISGLTPIGTPVAFWMLVGRLRAIQLLSGEREARKKALTRAVIALVQTSAASPDRVYFDEHGRLQQRQPNDPTLLIQTLNAACQTASPPIQDQSLIAMVIDAAIPMQMDRGPCPRPYVLAQWRRHLGAAIQEDMRNPLGLYQGYTRIHYARAIPILLGFAQFYFSWISERGTQDYGHPRPLTRRMLEAFLNREFNEHYLPREVEPELRCQALHELAWRVVGFQFLQNHGLGLKNGGPIQRGQLLRYTTLFEPFRQQDDGLLSLSRALLQFQEVEANTPEDDDEGQQRRGRALRLAADRLLTVIRLLMHQPDWKPPASQLRHFLELANKLCHRFLGQESIPVFLMKEVVKEAKRMMTEKTPTPRAPQHECQHSRPAASQKNDSGRSSQNTSGARSSFRQGASSLGRSDGKPQVSAPTDTYEPPPEQADMVKAIRALATSLITFICSPDRSEASRPCVEALINATHIRLFSVPGAQMNEATFKETLEQALEYIQLPSDFLDPTAMDELIMLAIKPQALDSSDDDDDKEETTGRKPPSEEDEEGQTSSSGGSSGSGSSGGTSWADFPKDIGQGRAYPPGLPSAQQPGGAAANELTTLEWQNQLKYPESVWGTEKGGLRPKAPSQEDSEEKGKSSKGG